MKLPFFKTCRAIRAFTLTELMVACTIFTMVIGGVVYAHITGLKMFEWVRVKVGASDDARKTLSLLVDEVRSSQDWQVGEGGSTTFVTVPDGDEQEGNAVKVLRPDWHATQNSNSFIIYYLDYDTSNLMRREGTRSPTVVAQSLTNDVVFTATDYRGVTVTEKDATQVLSVNMEFFQIRFPIVEVGTNKQFDYYRMSTRISRRSM